MKKVGPGKRLRQSVRPNAPHLGEHETLAFIYGPAFAQLHFTDPVRLLGIGAGTGLAY
jgi:hypothetical protein